MRFHVIVPALVALLLLVSGPGPLQGRPAHAAQALPTYLRADMATLDRAFVAALALTSQEKPEPSRKSMAVLVPTWKAFQAKYISVNPADGQWRADFDTVDGMIERADELVRAGGALVAAHDELEGVRITMMALRERNGIAYYLDHLTRFHEPMEAIVLAGKEKTPETLTAADVEAIRSHLPLAHECWNAALAADFDAALFGFPAEKQAAMKRLIAAESESLAQLQAAIDGGDPALTIQRAVGIKPSFAALFMLFGDFETVS